MRHGASCVTADGDPPPRRSFPLSSRPPEAFERRRDASLIGCAEPGNIDVQAVLRYLQHRDALSGGEEACYRVFPGVDFVPGLLLWNDELALEIGVWPPAEALPVKMHCFSKELIAVPG